MKSILGHVAGNRLAITAILLALAISIAVSIGTLFRYQSGLLMLAWCALWVTGAGALGYRLRSWPWAVICPVAMIAVVMVWEVIYGRTSWASLYVFMIGATYAVAATIGALAGTLLGKRRSGERMAKAGAMSSATRRSHETRRRRK